MVGGEQGRGILVTFLWSWAGIDNNLVGQAPNPNRLVSECASVPSNEWFGTYIHIVIHSRKLFFKKNKGD